MTLTPRAPPLPAAKAADSLHAGIGRPEPRRPAIIAVVVALTAPRVRPAVDLIGQITRRLSRAH